MEKVKSSREWRERLLRDKKERAKSLVCDTERRAGKLECAWVT